MKLRSLADRMSLQTQIAIATAMLCVLLVLGASLGAAWLGRSKASVLIGAELAELAEVMADKLDRGMFERYREIGVVADLEVLRPVWGGNPEDLRAILDRLQRSFPDYAWIGFATPDGSVRAATRGMLEGASVAQRPWFREALDGAFVGDVHEALLLAKLLGPRADSEPFRFVDVAHPVRDAAGNVIGVLGAHLSWDWVEEVRRSILDASSNFAAAEIMVLDTGGRVLLGPQTGRVLADAPTLAGIRATGRGYGIGLQTDPQQHGRWLTGYATSVGYRDYPGLGWIVVVRQPADIANRPVRELATSILLYGLVLGLLGIALAWWLAGRLARPIRSITAEAERIGRDPGMQTLPRLGGTREVLRLSQALRSLLRRVGIAEQRLEAVTRDMEHQAAESRELSADIARLRELAEHDPLTGLLNRRAFLEAAERQIAYARRYRRGLAVVVADIDHFKGVNDTHGHSAGDAAIREVAGRMQAAARDTDLVARFGGEEFVALLMESDIAAAVAYAERVRLAIAATPVGLGEHGSVPLSISLGCTVLGEGDRDVQDAIDRADGALYAAKAAGRNRVRISLSGPSTATG